MDESTVWINNYRSPDEINANGNDTASQNAKIDASGYNEPKINLNWGRTPSSSPRSSEPSSESKDATQVGLKDTMEDNFVDAVEMSESFQERIFGVNSTNLITSSDIKSQDNDFQFMSSDVLMNVQDIDTFDALICKGTGAESVKAWGKPSLMKFDPLVSIDSPSDPRKAASTPSRNRNLIAKQRSMSPTLEEEDCQQISLYLSSDTARECQQRQEPEPSHYNEDIFIENKAENIIEDPLQLEKVVPAINDEEEAKQDEVDNIETDEGSKEPVLIAKDVGLTSFNVVADDNSEPQLGMEQADAPDILSHDNNTSLKCKPNEEDLQIKLKDQRETIAQLKQTICSLKSSKIGQDGSQSDMKSSNLKNEESEPPILLKQVDHLELLLKQKKQELEHLLTEVDDVKDILVQTETAFDELHRRYEVTKCRIKLVEENTDVLTSRQLLHEAKLSTLTRKLSSIKDDIDEKKTLMRNDYEQRIEALETENKTTQAQLNYSNFQCQEVEKSIAQKIAENEQLKTLFNDMVSKEQ